MKTNEGARAQRLSGWGIVSLVLLLGEFMFGEHNLRMHEQTGNPWMRFALANQVCVVVQLAAVVCGVIAMRRGSKWWALTVVPALVIAIGCYFGDL